MIEREDDHRGSFVVAVAGDDGALQAGEAWSNAERQRRGHARPPPTPSAVARAPKPPLRCRIGEHQPCDANREVSATGVGRRRDRGALPVDVQRPGRSRRPTTRPSPRRWPWSEARWASTRPATQWAATPARQAPGLAGRSRRRPGTADTGTTSQGDDRREGAGRPGADGVRPRLGQRPGHHAARAQPVLQVARATASCIKGARQVDVPPHLPRPGKKRIQVKEYPSAPGFETGGFSRSDDDAEGPDRQARLAAPEDRRQGQGRQAGEGPHVRVDAWHEVPLPVVRRQEGDPRGHRQEAADHPLAQGQEDRRSR